LLFNSLVFIFLFLPVSFGIYFYLNKKRLTTISKAFLVFSSLFFYSWWNIAYLPIILASILFNYVAGVSLSKDEEHTRVSKKSLLVFGVTANVLLLAYFKYADFLIDNLNLAAGTSFPLLHLALPLAISFFTFQQIAYLVDSYKGKTREYDFLNYANFVTFFPQLIAGPIVHHQEMMPQFSAIRNMAINHKHLAMGVFIFSIGLFKKIVIADTFAIWATAGFDTATTLNLFEAWATSLSFTFQLYFDFSGYTDMAIGLALLFNIKLPINFNSPYKSTSMIEVWTRCHITLSRFVNQYIFKPVLKLFKKYSFGKGMLALFISMVILGLWHGASWMFVWFGVMHGAGLVVNHTWKKKIKIKLPHLLGLFITFNFINISMVLFRAREWGDATRVLGAMFSVDNIMLPEFLAGKISLLDKIGVSFGNVFSGIQGGEETFIWLCIGFFITMLMKNSIELLDNFKCNYKTLTFSLILFITSILLINKASEFLYFNFLLQL